MYAYVYIRHFHKEYRNGKNDIFPYDPRILPDKAGEIPLLTRQLLAAYGPPKAIFCSPYERTRQTAALLAPLDVPIIVDRNLSEYIGKHHEKRLNDNSIRGRTAKYHPPAAETSSMLDNRIEQHITTREKLSEDVYWFITHGVIVRKTLEYNNVAYYPKPLEAVVVDPNGVIPPFSLLT